MEGEGKGEFDEPGGLLIAPDGTLLVADQCNNHVQRLSAEGKFLSQFGVHGNAPGQFGGADKKAAASAIRTSASTSGSPAWRNGTS